MSAIPARLRWCVGKFIYARGASEPLHFMELKRFIIDDAVDFSHLFFLRGLRLMPRAAAETDESFQRWMSATAVKPAAEALAYLLEERQGAPVLEFYPGVGLVFEYLKLLRARAGVRPLAYSGCGPAAAGRKFVALHDRDGGTPQYRGETDPHALAVLEGVIGFYNHEQSIRLDDEPRITLAGFIGATRGPALVAARVTAAHRSQWHTTVKGRRLELPSLAATLEQCRPLGCYYRFVPGHDAGFLLPDGGDETGLLIACIGSHRPPLAGFKAG
jgi:hypothetical protein